MEVDDNPSFDVVIDAIGNLPSDLFTEASKSRLIAATDFYRQLKTRIGSKLMYLVANGSAAHGYAKETHDLDLFPVYDDTSFSDSDHNRIFSNINGLTAELCRKYGFEISPKPLPNSIAERTILATADNPPYIVLGNRKEFYKVYNAR